MDVPLNPGQVYRFRAQTGVEIVGVAQQILDGFVTISTEQGEVLLAWQHIVAIAHPDCSLVPHAEAHEELPAKTRKKRAAAGSASGKKGKDWSSDELKSLVGGFLDGETDADLALRFGARRGMIASMRQAFECQRGNFVEDEIDSVAKTWVGRIQEALNDR